jgi:hypothetical protein
MKPQTIGRALGIGVRVAGRIAGQRINASAQAATVAPRAEIRAEVLGKATGNVKRGVGGFLRPFRRVGGILWLEVTGTFFLLFALIFAQSLWRVRASYAQGPEHNRFLVAGVMVALFLYLSVSSFWRARKR